MSLPETAHTAVSVPPPLIPVAAIEQAVQQQYSLCARDDDDLYRQKTLDQEAGAICFLRALDKHGRAGFSKGLALVTPR